MVPLRTTLMVLIAVRLLMPPGICACKWSSPAGRCLATLLQTERPVPTPEERDDDDHAPGCPASPLAVGMGVKPPSEPLLPPAPSLDLAPPPAAEPAVPALVGCAEPSAPFDPPPNALYLTLRALLI